MKTLRIISLVCDMTFEEDFFFTFCTEIFYLPPEWPDYLHKMIVFTPKVTDTEQD